MEIRDYTTEELAEREFERAREETELPENRLISEISSAKYHELDRCSASQLEQLYRDVPAIARYKFENSESKKAFDFGSLVHALVLEPETVEDRYIKIDSAKCLTKDGKVSSRPTTSAYYKQAIAEYPGKTIMLDSEFNASSAVASEILDNGKLKGLLRATRHKEASLFWQLKEWNGYELESPLECKTRFDGIHLESGIIWDIKTTADASQTGFFYQARKLGYHRKAAFYLEAAKRIDPNKNWQFLLIAIRNTAPYLTALYRVPMQDEYHKGFSIEQGRAELLKPIEQYLKCTKNNDWPGYSSEVVDLVPTEHLV